MAKYPSSTGITAGGSTLSKNPPSCARTGAVWGSRAINAAETIRAGNSATMAEYAEACARLRMP